MKISIIDLPSSRVVRNVSAVVAVGLLIAFIDCLSAAEQSENGIDLFMKLHFSDSMTTDDVVKILQLKVGADTNFTLIKEIAYRFSNNPDFKFSLTDPDIDRLKKAGASDELIQAMRSPVAALRYDATHRTEVGDPGEPVASPSATPAPTASASSTESPAEGKTADSEQSLVSISAGAYVVKRPKEWMDDESAFHMLDEKPRTIWASPRGDISPETMVIALPEKTVLKRLEFDNSHIDSQFTGCSAKDIMVEMSDTSASDGFQTIADVSLKDQEEHQTFPVSAEVPGRWVRLTVKNNHNPKDTDSTIELNEFRAYGTQLTHTPLKDVSGTYDTFFTNGLHLKQEGMSVTGCYEARNGRIEGGIEDRAFKFTYFEDYAGKFSERGVGVMVFSPDGKQLFSLWEGEGRERLILGTKKSDAIGSCPQWPTAAKNVSAVEDQMTKDLQEFGRVRVYGVNFDSDSDRIKPESKPTLDKIAGMLKAKPDWKITIEGHTDSTSTPQHNQGLSERRAASVKTYLVGVGIEGSRLTTAGYGQTKPVASNDTPMGRAQNRRVELGKL